jgi:peptide/nickel transport system substrate-binding protein
MFNHKGHKNTQSSFFRRLKDLRVPSCSLWLTLFALCATLLSCSSKPAPDTLVMAIEFSPANLDPRVGTDAQSERIDELLFDSLVRKDEHFNIVPAVAESWDIPDPQTYIFHLHRGIHFHDGRLLTARDVKWTLDSVRNGSLVTIKGAAYKDVDRVEALDDATLLIHLSEPFTPLLWNLTDGAFGIVPYGSDKDFKSHPIGSGPFRFVRNDADSQVIIERNNDYWGEQARVARIRFEVVPDMTTRALELRKGSADLTPPNALTSDMVGVLERDPNLQVLRRPGTTMAYLALNLRDPILKDVRVRQALAYAIDREPMLHYFFGDRGRLADSVLPPEHWAYYGKVAHYPYDPARANALLDDAGYRRAKDGVRFHLTMKISTTEETSRLMAVVLQQQFQKIGVVLDIRSFEFALLYSEILRGNFQLYSLRWVGYSNQDPDIFEDAFHSASFPPKRANRGYYYNPRVDSLLEEGHRTLDQARRKQIYTEVQQILAHDLPYIDLWYLDNVMVHSIHVKNVNLTASGNYDFLTTAELNR